VDGAYYIDRYVREKEIKNQKEFAIRGQKSSDLMVRSEEVVEEDFELPEEVCFFPEICSA